MSSEDSPETPSPAASGELSASQAEVEVASSSPGAASEPSAEPEEELASTEAEEEAASSEAKEEAASSEAEDEAASSEAEKELASSPKDSGAESTRASETEQESEDTKGSWLHQPRSTRRAMAGWKHLRRVNLEAWKSMPRATVSQRMLQHVALASSGKTGGNGALSFHASTQCRKIPCRRSFGW